MKKFNLNQLFGKKLFIIPVFMCFVINANAKITFTASSGTITSDPSESEYLIQPAGGAALIQVTFTSLLFNEDNLNAISVFDSDTYGNQIGGIVVQDYTTGQWISVTVTFYSTTGKFSIATDYTDIPPSFKCTYKVITTEWLGIGDNIVYSGRKVGIGSDNPYATMLQVNKQNIGGIGGSIFITNTAPTTYGNTARLGFDLTGFDDITPSASIDGKLSDAGVADLIFNTYDGSGSIANYERMRILGTNGNILIGKTLQTNATYKLDIAGTVNATKFVGDGSGLTGISASQWITSGSNVYYTTGAVSIGTASPMSGYKLDVSGKMRASYYNLNAYSTNYDDFAVYATTDVGTTITSAGATNIAFRTNNAERLRIGSNGSVGIGTTSPQATLHVAGDLRVDGTIFHRGTLKSQEIKVEVPNGTWKDYVFSKTYKLKTLGEVEQYIQINGHLPEIPSAKEVEQNGVSVGDMQAKLLQKVEELTLYSIEQNKELLRQKKENKALKERLEEQDAKYELLLKVVNELKNK